MLSAWITENSANLAHTQHCSMGNHMREVWDMPHRESMEAEQGQSGSHGCHCQGPGFTISDATRGMPMGRRFEVSSALVMLLGLVHTHHLLLSLPSCLAASRADSRHGQNRQLSPSSSY